MIITIQPLNKGYAINLTDIYLYPNMTQHEITEEATKFVKLVNFRTGKKHVIKWLPIQHTPMKTKKKTSSASS